MAVTATDWLVVSPFLALSLLGCIVLVLGLVYPKMFRETLGSIVLVGLAGTLFFTLQNWGDPATAFSGMVLGDKYATAFNCMFLFGAALTLLLSMNQVEGSYLIYADYLAIVVFCTAGMVLMASGGHLLTIFLGLETLSIGLYILAGSRRTNAFALESAFKYFLLGAFASGFLLYGIALVYGATGTADLGRIAEAVNNGAVGSQLMLVSGTVMLFVGFGFKVALFPFHMWAPDVYQGAPTPVAAFMATGSKAAGFAAMLRVVLALDMSNMVGWQDVLWITAVVTILVGNIIALRQENIKRMLAYSSIAHAGYVLIGVIAGNQIGASGVVFYLLVYTFMNIGAFGVISYLSTSEHEFNNLSDFKGLASRRPFAAIAMSAFMLSLAGIPPTAGFIGKFYIFSSAVAADFVWLAVIGVIGSMISLYYYLGVIVQMYLTEADADVPESAATQPYVALALGFALFAVINLGIFPSRWLEAFKSMAASLM